MPSPAVAVGPQTGDPVHEIVGFFYRRSPCIRQRVLPFWTASGTVIRPGNFPRGSGSKTLVEPDEVTIPKRSLMAVLVTPAAPISAEEMAEVRALVKRYRPGPKVTSSKGTTRTLVTLALAAAIGAFFFGLVIPGEPVRPTAKMGTAVSAAQPARASSEPKELVRTEERVEHRTRIPAPLLARPAPKPAAAHGPVRVARVHAARPKPKTSPKTTTFGPGEI